MGKGVLVKYTLEFTPATSQDSIDAKAQGKNPRHRISAYGTDRVARVVAAIERKLGFTVDVLIGRKACAVDTDGTVEHLQAFASPKLKIELRWRRTDRPVIAAPVAPAAPVVPAPKKRPSEDRPKPTDSFAHQAWRTWALVVGRRAQDAKRPPAETAVQPVAKKVCSDSHVAVPDAVFVEDEYSSPNDRFFFEDDSLLGLVQVCLPGPEGPSTA
jgi:hypothetical protein